VSQFFKGVSSGDLPPEVPLQFTTDDGVAVPAANNLNVIGASSSVNYDTGIYTTSPGNNDDLFIVLSNRFTNSVQTTDAADTVLVDQQLTEDGVYTFEVKVSAYNVTDLLGAAYSLFFGIILTSGTATKLGLEDKITNAQGAMVNCVVSVSTTDDRIIITVNGLAGKTIEWLATATYSYVGA